MALTKYPRGLQKASLVSKTANYTAVETDDIILCNSSGGAFTVTLPAAATYSGKILTLKKTDSTFATANAITIDGNGSETIDGATTTTLNTQYETLEIISDGSNWHVVKRTIPSVWTAFTPTSNATNCTHTGYWRRVGDSIDLAYRLSFTGAPSAISLLTLDLVSGLTMDTSKSYTGGASYNHQIGHGYLVDNSANAVYPVIVQMQSSTAIGLYNATGTANWFNNPTTHTNPFTIASPDEMQFKMFGLPITGWNG